MFGPDADIFFICIFRECFVNPIERQPRVDFSKIISKGAKKGFLVALTPFDVTKNKTRPDSSQLQTGGGYKRKKDNSTPTYFDLNLCQVRLLRELFRKTP